MHTAVGDVLVEAFTGDQCSSQAQCTTGICVIETSAAIGAALSPCECPLTHFICPSLLFSESIQYAGVKLQTARSGPLTQGIGSLLETLMQWALNTHGQLHEHTPAGGMQI